MFVVHLGTVTHGKECSHNQFVSVAQINPHWPICSRMPKSPPAQTTPRSPITPSAMLLVTVDLSTRRSKLDLNFLYKRTSPKPYLTRSSPTHPAQHSSSSSPSHSAGLADLPRMRHLPSPPIPPLLPLPPPSSLLGGANTGLPQPDLHVVARERGFRWRRQPEDRRRWQPEDRFSMVEAVGV
jgi:hypothetical protein